MSVTAYRLWFWCLLTIVAILSIVSLQHAQQLFDWQDKLHHLLAYAVLFWLLLGAYGKQQSIWTLGVLLAVFSGLIEVAQSYTGYRQAELLDLLANITGILLGGLAHPIKRGV